MDKPNVEVTTDLLKFLYNNKPIRRCYNIDIFYEFILASSECFDEIEDMIEAAMDLKRQFFTNISDLLEQHYPDPLNPIREYFEGISKLTSEEIEAIIHLDEQLDFGHLLQSSATPFHSNVAVEEYKNSTAGTHSPDFITSFRQITTTLLNGTDSEDIMSTSEIVQKLHKLGIEEIRQMRLNLLSKMKPINEAQDQTPRSHGLSQDFTREDQNISTSSQSMLSLKSLSSHENQNLVQAISTSGGTTSDNPDEAFGRDQIRATSTPQTDKSHSARLTRRRGHQESFEEFKRRFKTRCRL